MNDTEQLYRMTLRLSARVSALEAALAGLLAVHAHLHGSAILQETVALMRALPPRQTEELSQDTEAWLQSEQEWCLEELCKTAAARLAKPSEPGAQR